MARNLIKAWDGAMDLRQKSMASNRQTTTPNAASASRFIYRKLQLGTQCDRGERSIERLLSASITWRLRQQSLFAYLTEVITAHARGDPIPALS